GQRPGQSRRTDQAGKAAAQRRAGYLGAIVDRHAGACLQVQRAVGHTQGSTTRSTVQSDAESQVRAGEVSRRGQRRDLHEGAEAGGIERAAGDIDTEGEVHGEADTGTQGRRAAGTESKGLSFAAQIEGLAEAGL